MTDQELISLAHKLVDSLIEKNASMTPRQWREAPTVNAGIILKALRLVNNSNQEERYAE